MKKLLLVSLIALGASSYFIEASALRTAGHITIKALKQIPGRASSTLIQIKTFSEIEGTFHPYDRQSGNPADATLRTLYRIEKQIQSDGYLAGDKRMIPLEKLIALVSQNFKVFLQSRPAEEKSKYVGKRYAEDFIEILKHYYDSEIPVKMTPLLINTINADEKELRESISSVICLR